MPDRDGHRTHWTMPEAPWHRNTATRPGLTLYIAGPMRGYPLWNFPAFDEAERLLQRIGHIPVSPAAMDRAEGIDETADSADVNYPISQYYVAMRRDIPAVMAADGIVLLRGWERSNGANVERTVNSAVGGREFIVLYDENTDAMFDIYEVRK